MTKPYVAKSDAALQRAINRFADACHDKVLQGAILYGESEYAAACYDAIDDRLDASRAALERLIERRIQQ